MSEVTRHTGSAAVLASLAAGPIALAIIGVGYLLSGQAIGLTLDPDQTGPAVAGMIWLSVIAAIIALIPNVIGVTVMGWLARWNVGFRHPAIWALVGGITAGLPAWLSMEYDFGNAFTAGWAAIGALSALVCRARVRWEEAAAV